MIRIKISQIVSPFSSLTLATILVLGYLLNPLLVVPLQPASSQAVFSAEKNECDGPKLSNLAGAGYQNYENSVLEKMLKCRLVRSKVTREKDMGGVRRSTLCSTERLQ